MNTDTTIPKKQSGFIELYRSLPLNKNLYLVIVAIVALGFFSDVTRVMHTDFELEENNDEERSSAIINTTTGIDFGLNNVTNNTTFITTTTNLTNTNPAPPTTRHHEENLERLSLPELVKRRSPEPLQCSSKMYPIQDIHNPVADEGKGRKIPRIIHVTGKTRCLLPPFHDNLKQWQFENHSFYFHDDEAVHRLVMERDWPMFPQLKNSMECLKDAGGAAKADLWRYLALWEYGGIYTDIDNAPGPNFLNGSIITPDTDALFIQERGGFASQYFFAVSPQHPVMFFAVHVLMKNMHDLADTGNFYVPVETGPGVIKGAFLRFMGFPGDNSEEARAAIYKQYAKPSAGHYIGKGPFFDGNHSVTIVGTRRTGDYWVQRAVVTGQAKKNLDWDEYRQKNLVKSGMSCVLALYKKHKSQYYPNSQQELVQEWERHRRRYRR